MSQIALVLSGGGSKGAYQAGFYDELRKAEVPINIISGVSVGALNAAYIACGKGNQLIMLWKLMSRDRIYRKRLGGILGAYLCGRNALYDTMPLRRLINEEIDFDRLRASHIMLRVSCCDVLTGKTVMFCNRGVDTQVLMGTCAIPGMFPPVPYEDALLIDGGIKNNMPIGAAIDAGADVVICINTVPQQQQETMYRRTWLDILMRAAHIEIADNMAGDVKLAEITNYCPEKKNVNIISIAPQHRIPEKIFELEFNQQLIEYLIAEGRHDAEVFLNRHSFLY